MMQALKNQETGKTQQKEHRDGWAGVTQEAGPLKNIQGACALVGGSVVKCICLPWLSGMELLE